MNASATVPPEKFLRLVAFDQEDLAILSAHLQDAIARVGDMAFLPEERRFVLVLGRFDWLAHDRGRCERRLCGLHFNNVRAARQQDVPQQTPEAFLNLLSVAFEQPQEQMEAPSGWVRLDFSGGATIRLNVECLEAHFSDLGPCWQAASRPDHTD